MERYEPNAESDSDSEHEEAQIQLETYLHVVLGVNALRGRALDHAEQALVAEREATREVFLQIQRDLQQRERLLEKAKEELRLRRQHRAKSDE